MKSESIYVPHLSRISLLLLLAIAACDTGSDALDQAPDIAADSMAAEGGKKGGAVRPSVPDTIFPEIRYNRYVVSDRKALDSLRKNYARKKETMDAYRALTTLNRKELGYIRVGDTIVVPDSIVADLRAYSVFPARYPAADTIPKIIIVSNAMQSYACYEHGRLVRFAAANTGRESKATYPGRYALNWRERLRVSSLNENWKLPFNWNFHLYAGNAFHQFEMPGRPVSHSCVRQFAADAEWLFDWGSAGARNENGRVIQLTGTPVIIIDMFDFTRKKGGPWLELASNRDGMLTLPDNPMGVEEALIPISQVPREVRGGLPNRSRYVHAEDTLRARGIIRDGTHLSPSITYTKKPKAVKKPRWTAEPEVRPVTIEKTETAEKPAETKSSGTQE